jgi:hypothetical protein
MKKLEELNKLLGKVESCARRASGMTQNFKAISKTEAIRIAYVHGEAIPNGKNPVCEEDLDNVISSYMKKIDQGSKNIKARLSVLQLKKKE